MSLRKIIKHLLASTPPKARNTYHTTDTTNTYYQGMNQDYRWFRQDELTRKCITTNALFATANGFETTIEAPNPEKHTELKETIDQINKQVNLDKTLYTAQIKRSIHGKAAYEIIRDNDNTPTRLLPLQSTQIKPDIDENWNLTGYTYQSKPGFYQPDEILYFTNMELEADHQGLSDIEPLRDILTARHMILRENLPEIARTLWAPYVILKADTSGLTEEEAEQVIEQLAEIARAGKSIAINESIEATTVNLTPDIDGLNKLLDKLEQAIIANYGTPRFLLGKPIENRATAYAELEAYVETTIKGIQRELKREIERQWYDPITRNITKDQVQIKHVWNPVRVTDIYQIADAAAKLWGTHGTGPIGGNRPKIWELMGWDPNELEDPQ